MLILLLIATVGGLGYYCYNLNQKLNDVEKENEKKDEQEKTEKLEEDILEIKYTLFDTPVYLKKICSKFLENGICNKNLGNFNLNNNIYSANISLFLTEEVGEYSFGEGMQGYLKINNKNIELSGFVDKIEKIHGNYLGIFSKMSDGSNNLNIYDDELNLIATYTADDKGFVINNNVIEFTEPRWFLD